jgi:hypothetical protein
LAGLLRLLSVANGWLREVHLGNGQQAVVDCTFAAIFHQTQFFKIEGADWSVIFLLRSSHSHTLDSW